MNATALPRIPNGPQTPQDQRQHCTYCCDEGVVPVGAERRDNYRRVVVPTEGGGRKFKMVPSGHHDEEVWGPCPMCEIGYAVEFPEHSKWPWGALGYWRGRPTVFPKQCRCDLQPATEQQRRDGMAASREALTGAFPHPDAPARPHVVQLVQDAHKTAQAAPAAVTPPDPAHHRCVGYDGRDMPWPESECDFCRTGEEITL